MNKEYETLKEISSGQNAIIHNLKILASAFYVTGNKEMSDKLRRMIDTLQILNNKIAEAL